MIVRMKEIWLFTSSGSVENTVQALGELGVVEIRKINTTDIEQIAWTKEKVVRAESAISILEKYTASNKISSNRKKYKSSDPTNIIDRVLISGDYIKWCKKTLDHLELQLNWYKTWGETIELNDFNYLRMKGIYIRLYLVDKTILNTLPTDKYLLTFDEKEGKTPVALFARSESEKLDFEEVELPELPLHEVKRNMVRKKRQLAEVEYFLGDQAENMELLRDYHSALTDQLNARKVIAGMGHIEEGIKYLRGYIPYDVVDRFKKIALINNWGYQISEPENPEEVPVLIRNPKWVSIINPVLKFIDIVPGYKEVDVSIYFLIAFALFFAMLVGDAGYGAIFLISAFLLRNKLAPQVRLLIYVLSGATIIWGVLSGTYFGSEQIAAVPFFKNMIIPEIASFGVDNISFMMHLSFVIGAIHLTVAHCVRFFQFKNSVRALSELGWVAFVWGLFLVAEKLVLGKALPLWSNWLFWAGAALVVLFSREGKNVRSSMLMSIANLPLSLINGFSDIVSYVRLFAVGMASATVASSFNGMALPAGVDLSFFEMLVAAAALLLGHGLNIILALMAVMVHGIRLNMLEFSGHLGIQFSGEAYQPFKLNGARKEPVE